MIGHAIVPLVAIVCGTFVSITILQLIGRYVTQRRANTPGPSSDEVTRRLERIEQMVESTAIEVERLGESSRFVAKLLAETTEALRP